MVRFQSGEGFVSITKSAAATCSFNLTSTLRDIRVEGIYAMSDLSNAVVTVQASGTTRWINTLGSSCVPSYLLGLYIENDGTDTLSGNITGSTVCELGFSGKYRLL